MTTRLIVVDLLQTTPSFSEMVTSLGDSVSVVQTCNTVHEVTKLLVGESIIHADLFLWHLLEMEHELLTVMRQIGERVIPSIAVTANPHPEMLRQYSTLLPYCVGETTNLAQLETAILVAISQTEAMRALLAKAENLSKALEQKKLIERAKDIVSEQSKIGKKEAYERMRTFAQNNGFKVTHVARLVILVQKLFDNKLEREPL